MKITVFMGENGWFRQEILKLRRKILKLTFPPPRRERKRPFPLALRAPLGESGTAWFVMHRSDTRLDAGQIWQWWRCQQPDSQLEPIFYPGARSFKERHPGFVESPPALNAGITERRERDL